MREVIVALLFGVLAVAPLAAEPTHWRLEWPDTDFARRTRRQNHCRYAAAVRKEIQPAAVIANITVVRGIREDNFGV